MITLNLWVFIARTKTTEIMDKDQVLEIVDKCFKMYASSYRIEANEYAIEIIDTQLGEGQSLPIHNVVGSFWSDNAITRLKAEYFEKGLKGK